MKYDKGLEPLSTLNSELFEKYRVAYCARRPTSWDVRIGNPLMTLWKNWRIAKMRFIVTR